MSLVSLLTKWFTIQKIHSKVYPNSITMYSLWRHNFSSSICFLFLFFFFLSGFSFTDTDNSQDSRGRERTIFYSTLPLPPAHIFLIAMLVKCFQIQKIEHLRNETFSLKNYTRREKCPNTKIFLVHIFWYSDWIRRDTLLFSPNTEKCGPEKTSYLDTFHAVTFWEVIIFSVGNLEQQITMTYTIYWQTHSKVKNSFIQGVNENNQNVCGEYYFN